MSMIKPRVKLICQECGGGFELLPVVELEKYRLVRHA